MPFRQATIPDEVRELILRMGKGEPELGLLEYQHRNGRLRPKRLELNQVSSARLLANELNGSCVDASRAGTFNQSSHPWLDQNQRPR